MLTRRICPGALADSSCYSSHAFAAVASLTKAEEKSNPGARRALGLDMDTVYVSTSAQPLYMVFEFEVCNEGWEEGVVILPVSCKTLHLPHSINRNDGFAECSPHIAGNSSDEHLPDRQYSGKGTGAVNISANDAYLSRHISSRHTWSDATHAHAQVHNNSQHGVPQGVAVEHPTLSGIVLEILSRHEPHQFHPHVTPQESHVTPQGCHVTPEVPPPDLARHAVVLDVEITDDDFRAEFYKNIIQIPYFENNAPLISDPGAGVTSLPSTKTL